jgi:hypothetical protein
MGNLTVHIFAIRNKHSGVFLQFKHKAAWTSVGAAKNAFGLHMPRLYNESKGYYQQRFDDQDEYEIVDLVEAFYRLEGLCK